MISMSTSSGKLIKVAVGNFALISQRLDWDFVVRASMPKLSTAGLMWGSCHFYMEVNDEFNVEFWMFILIFLADIKIRSERSPIH